MMTCVTDYSVITNEDIVIPQETGLQEEKEQVSVVIDYYVQPEKPEDLDVLVVLDTSCSMSDNFENVSIGLDILRDDIEVLTFDYQMALINTSLRETYYVGPILPDTSSMEIFIAPYALASDNFEEAFATLYLLLTHQRDKLF